jgi:ribonuclease HII|tara:strand:+ start:724 stop:1395 length:672 start_codon:yes stop_codon:yes gene_type:complete
MLKLGIDDAGRGPVIGPMVLAGCLIDSKTETEFRRLGVKDSKQLSEKRREFLAKIIKEKAETFEIIIIDPKKIDRDSEIGIKLNEVEAFACARIINKINKGYKELRVILDCPSTSLVKWKDFLKTKIDNLSNLEILCEHKADKNYISVSAASILAKSAREKEMSKLKEKFGKDLGSGYTSDPLTKRFLEKNIKRYNDHGIFRKSWSTWKVAVGNLNQKKLNEF